MKTMKFYVFMMLLLIPLLVPAQELSPNLNNLKKAQSPADFVQARNQLERLNLVAPDNWLILYYLAYTDVELSFRIPTKEEKMRYLDEAHTYLKKLSDLSDADFSEVYTLRGYQIYALIATDPQTNGPKYFSDVSTWYEKALRINPNNPRALLLSALFKNDTAKFMNDIYENFYQDIEKAVALLTTENTEGLTPTWGKEWVDRILKRKH